MSDLEKITDHLTGRGLANEAAFEALLLAVLTEHPRLKDAFIRNLDAQMSKANRVLDGDNLSGFSQRLEWLKKELLTQ